MVIKFPKRCWHVACLVFTGLVASAPTVDAASLPLPTDRARVTVASVPDPYGGPNLKVLRTDANTPLRAGTAWIWEKQGQEEPASYYASMRAKGLNAVRMILFDTWEVETYTPGPSFTPTDWNDAAYRTRQLARMERSVNYASANGMYIIINSHNHIPSYNETYVNALWTYVAPYFANRTHVLYEAANEPMSGIGTNGDMDQGGNAQNSPRLQALKRTYNIIRAGAPDTHIMVLTPPGINDSAYGTGMGNLAASFAALPGAVDWTKTSVAYHLYNNDAAYGVANNAANLRNLHSRYPGWPSENAFPPGNIPGAIGLDQWRSQPFPGDWYVNQTCERLGLGWSMWFINGQNQLDTNFPIMWADAVAKGWTWTPDPTSAGVLVPYSRSAPAIDGQMESLWLAAPENRITNVVLGTVTSTNDLAGSWRALWDQTNLYVFVEVSDNVKTNDSGTFWWDDDLVEVYLDANNSKGTSYDGTNDYQYVFRWNEPAVLETKLARTQGVAFFRSATSTGYRIEIRFPWATLGMTPTHGVRFGIEVMLNDDDNGGARERKLAWHGTSDQAYQNPGLFGVGELRLPTSAVTLIPAGAVWRYLDTTNNPGASWRSNTFSDLAWSNGLARLGFGLDGEVTTVASNRQWTTYFRRTFYVPDPGLVTSLSARLTRDDGALVYLNGAEIWRDTNMPSGVITHQSPALSALSAALETNWLSLSFSSAALAQLVPGWNLLAAEVHQSDLASSDLGFDLELTGAAAILEPPVLGVQLPGPGFPPALVWPAGAGIFSLATTTNLFAPVWVRATNNPVLTNGLWLVPLSPANGPQRFFRLQTP